MSDRQGNYSAQEMQNQNIPYDTREIKENIPTFTKIHANQQVTSETTKTMPVKRDVEHVENIVFKETVPTVKTKEITKQVPITRQVPYTENVEMTERVPKTTNEDVVREIPVTRTKHVTENVTVTERVPITDTVERIENVAVTKNVPVTKMETIHETVPFTNLINVTEKVPVTRNVSVTEHVPTTKFVPDNMPAVNVPLLGPQTIPLGKNVFKGQSDCIKCTGLGYLDDGRACEKCVNATGNCAVCKNTGLNLSDANKKCNCIYGRDRKNDK